MSQSNRLLDRRAVAATLLADRGNMVAVTGLGAPTYDAAAAGDHNLNFYLWGAMGGAAMIGLGLALARPEHHVLVLTGDGEMLMGAAGFATIAMQNPPNLTIAILDNGRYGETGGQESATARTSDLAAVARGFGIADAAVLTRMEQVESLAASLKQQAAGPRVRVIKIDTEDLTRVLPLRDGAEIRARVQAALADCSAT
jgi:thiamine pyrophosphate-dependent acetolactate synthase large subunit-like protein